MTRFAPPAYVGLAIVAATVASLVSTDPSFGLLVVVAVGAPLSVFLLVRALVYADGARRAGLSSLVLGATVVPVIVLLVRGVVVAVGYNLVAPFGGSRPYVVGAGAC